MFVHQPNCAVLNRVSITRDMSRWIGCRRQRLCKLLICKMTRLAWSRRCASIHRRDDVATMSHLARPLRSVSSVVVLVLMVVALHIAGRPSLADDVRRTTSKHEHVLVEGRRLLATIEDYTFPFDHEGFYWFCGALRSYPALLPAVDCGESTTPWQYLLERPSDYRGREVCIEGVLLQVKDAFRVADRPELGTLYQIEMGQPGSNAVATIVLLEPPPTALRKTRIRLPAFFIKARRFRTAGGGDGAGPLLVGRSFLVLDSQASLSPQTRNGIPDMSASTLLMWLAGSTLMMAFAFAWLRRWLGKGANAAVVDPTVRESADGITGTAEDFDWLDKDRD